MSHKAETKLSGAEVAEQLRCAIRGEVAVSLMCQEQTWNATFAGDCGFVIGGWTVVFFNDCDELDYCDSAIAPDGRKGEFDDWYAARQEPIDLLSAAEQQALLEILEDCGAGSA